jgi:hypothetical protein
MKKKFVFLTLVTLIFSLPASAGSLVSILDAIPERHAVGAAAENQIETKTEVPTDLNEGF